MLTVKGIDIWLEAHGVEKDSLVCQSSETTGSTATAIIIYRIREEVTLHWHAVEGPRPYSALFLIYAVDDVGNERRTTAIWLSEGWAQTQTRKADLEQPFAEDGLKTPYSPRQVKKNFVEGSLRLEIYRNPNIPDLDHSDHRTNEAYLDEEYLERLGAPFAVATFKFVHERCNAVVASKRGTYVDLDAEAHETDDDWTPNSPDEEPTIASRLRPRTLLKPPGHLATPVVLLNRPPVTHKRKRRVASSPDPDSDTAYSDQATSHISTIKRKRIAQASSVPEFLTGSSQGIVHHEVFPETVRMV
ncbi:hypothetical protein BDW22DRAFT_339209 [Trametopsis cervina]|nr:hypothetical protein BDW22DRAFT_339209 [Trametopsis cervina]